MKTILQLGMGSAAGGGLGYGLSDGLDPLVPFLLFGAAVVFLAALMLRAVERDVDRG